MTPDPRWLELLKASGWQTLAIAGACGLFLLLAHWRWLPPLDPWMIQLAAFSLLLAALLAFASIAAHMQARHEEKRTRDARRFEGIYSPLYNLFLTRHVTTFASAAPRLRHRLSNAANALHNIKRRGAAAAVRAAIRTLFERPITSAEVEYGGVFPLCQIQKIVRAHGQLADDRLLLLLARADRAQYEEATGGGGDMTSVDLELFNYVCDQHTRLNRKHA